MIRRILTLLKRNGQYKFSKVKPEFLTEQQWGDLANMYQAYYFYPGIDKKTGEQIESHPLDAFTAGLTYGYNLGKDPVFFEQEIKKLTR